MFSICFGVICFGHTVIRTETRLYIATQNFKLNEKENLERVIKVEIILKWMNSSTSMYSRKKWTRSLFLRLFQMKDKKEGQLVSACFFLCLEDLREQREGV